MTAQQIREYLLQKLEIIANNRDNAETKKEREKYIAQFDIVEDIYISIHRNN